MKFRIIRNENLCGAVFRMKAERGMMKDAAPGQFVHIRCSGSTVPLLRRPFSLAGMDDNSFEIIYRVVGAGTRALSRLAPGDELDALGPLGKGFPDIRGRILITAGGMGFAPMLYLAKKFAGRIKKFIYGAGTAEELFCCEEIASAGIDLLKATDDGTCGVKGDACSVLENCMANEAISSVYACGPDGMLEKACRISKKHSIPCFVSLESRIACGTGACLGCAVKMSPASGEPAYKLVCRDGPVFNGESIEWENRTSL